MSTADAALWLATHFLMQLALPLFVTVMIGLAMHQLTMHWDNGVEAECTEQRGKV